MALSHAKISAFGSTRHVRNSAGKDTNLQALVKAETPAITIFGKSWDIHVVEALHIELDENLDHHRRLPCLPQDIMRMI